MSTCKFDQFALFTKLNNTDKCEKLDGFQLRNILDGYECATWNRDLDMSDEEKSQRLYHIIVHQPVQNMIARKNVPSRYSARIMEKELGYVPAEYVLFDGCHRFSVVKEFLEGKCYVKMFNEEDDCYYYLWGTQAAVDAVTQDKEYHCKIEKELKDRLLLCRVSMTYLDPSCTDEYAYERARMANQSKPLTHAQIMKSMSAGKSFVAKLLRDIHVNDTLTTFLGDDIYRYYFSLIRMFLHFGFQADFRNHAVMLQGSKAITKAQELLTNTESPLDTIFEDKVRRAVKRARDCMNELLDTVAITDPKLIKMTHKRNSDMAAVGLFFFALGLACANANEPSSSTTTYYISTESIKDMMIKYLAMDSFEKGDNHKRLYAYFVTGVFPELSNKNKKQKLSHDEVGHVADID
jgi:hypothetical protein